MRDGPVPVSPTTCFLVALLVACLLPSVSAETVHFEEVTVNLGPETITARLADHRLEGEDARQLRGFIDDEHGDGDGEVTRAEVDAHTQDKMDELNDQLRLGGAFFFEPFKINDRPALEHRVTRISLSEPVLGDADSHETVVQEIHARLTFASTSKSRVDFSFEEDFRVPFEQVEMQWGNASFVPVDPWAVDPSSISPDGEDDRFFDGEAFQVPYEETGDFSSKQEPLTFQIVNTTEEDLDGRKEDSPGPAAGVVVAVLVVAIALVSRRRSS